MKLPIYVKNCIDRLESAGFSAYAVGGAVRDSLLGKEPSDWDVTTSATPDEILRVFENYHTIPTGIKHGTITVLFEMEKKIVPIEITTYRIDGEYRDSRHPESVEFSTELADDLLRRDFTVNAMAYNEKTGVVDCFGGMNDLESGIIRAVGDPQKRFTEDALRILRAFRFSAQLGFEIEEATFNGAVSCSYLLKNIARERIGVEFKKLLASDGMIYSLSKMIEGGVFGALFDIEVPEISLVDGLSFLESSDCFVRLSVLLANSNEDQINGFLNSLRFSNAEKKLTYRLISVKSFEAEGQELGIIARRFLYLYGDIYEPARAVLKFYHPQEEKLLDNIAFEHVQKRALTISSLEVRGTDLLPLCAGDHRKVGLILSALLERVIEDPGLNEHKKLLAEAQKLIEQ